MNQTNKKRVAGEVELYDKSSDLSFIFISYLTWNLSSDVYVDKPVLSMWRSCVDNKRNEKKRENNQNEGWKYNFFRQYSLLEMRKNWGYKSNNNNNTYPFSYPTHLSRWRKRKKKKVNTWIYYQTSFLYEIIFHSS